MAPFANSIFHCLIIHRRLFHFKPHFHHLILHPKENIHILIKPTYLQKRGKMFYIHYNDFPSPWPIFGTIRHLPLSSCVHSHRQTHYLTFSLLCIVHSKLSNRFQQSNSWMASIRQQFVVFVS